MLSDYNDLSFHPGLLQYAEQVPLEGIGAYPSTDSPSFNSDAAEPVLASSVTEPSAYSLLHAEAWTGGGGGGGGGDTTPFTGTSIDSLPLFQIGGGNSGYDTMGVEPNAVTAGNDLTSPSAAPVSAVDEIALSGTGAAVPATYVSDIQPAPGAQVPTTADQLNYQAYANSTEVPAQANTFSGAGGGPGAAEVAYPETVNTASGVTLPLTLPAGETTSADEIPTTYGAGQTTNGQLETATGQVQPTTGEVQPTTGEVQPTTGEVQPTTGEVQPITGEVQPISGEVQPITGQVQTTTGAGQTSNGGANSAAAQGSEAGNSVIPQSVVTALEQEGAEQEAQQEQAQEETGSPSLLDRGIQYSSVGMMPMFMLMGLKQLHDVGSAARGRIGGLFSSNDANVDPITSAITGGNPTARFYQIDPNGSGTDVIPHAMTPPEAMRVPGDVTFKLNGTGDPVSGAELRVRWAVENSKLKASGLKIKPPRGEKNIKLSNDELEAAESQAKAELAAAKGGVFKIVDGKTVDVKLSEAADDTSGAKYFVKPSRFGKPIELSEDELRAANKLPGASEAAAESGGWLSKAWDGFTGFIKHGFGGGDDGPEVPDVG